MKTRPASKRFTIAVWVAIIVFLSAIYLPILLVFSPFGDQRLTKGLALYYMIILVMYFTYRVVTAIVFSAAGLVGYTRDVRKFRALGEVPPTRTADQRSDAQLDPGHVQSALRDLNVVCGTCPRWVSEGVDAVLALAPGPDRREKRAELLSRLYWQAGFSSDPFEVRRAYNRLRIAINPNVDSPD